MSHLEGKGIKQSRHFKPPAQIFFTDFGPPVARNGEKVAKWVSYVRATVQVYSCIQGTQLLLSCSSSLAQWADWRWQQACKARWTNSHPNKAIEFHNVKLALSAITEIIRRDRHLIGLEETQPNWVVKNGQKIDSAWRIAEQKFSHVLIFFRSFVWLWIPLYFFLDMVNECRKMQIHVSSVSSMMLLLLRPIF